MNIVFFKEYLCYKYISKRLLKYNYFTAHSDLRDSNKHYLNKE